MYHSTNPSSEPVCPIEAIAYEDDLSEANAPFKFLAREVFAGNGSPGGAAGAPGVSEPSFVLALPPQEHDDVKGLVRMAAGQPAA